MTEQIPTQPLTDTTLESSINEALNPNPTINNETENSNVKTETENENAKAPTHTPTSDTTTEPVQNTNDDLSVSNDGVFTQTQVDEIVQKRIAREQAKHQSILENEIAKVKTETQTELENQILQLKTNYETVKQQLEQPTFNSEVSVTALKHGTQPDQIEAFTKLITVNDVTNDEGKIDPTLVEEQVQAVISKYPGLATPPAVGGNVATNVNHEPLSLADAIAKRMNNNQTM